MHIRSGRDTALLAGEQRAGAAEAGGHFVGDQQHAGLAARPTERRDVLRWRKAHAGRALHERFDDDCGQRVGVGRAPSRIAAIERAGGVDVGGAQHREPQRVEHVGAESARAYRQRTDGVAVVGAAEREIRRSWPSRPG